MACYQCQTKTEMFELCERKRFDDCRTHFAHFVNDWFEDFLLFFYHLPHCTLQNALNNVRLYLFILSFSPDTAALKLHPTYINRSSMVSIINFNFLSIRRNMKWPKVHHHYPPVHTMMSEFISFTTLLLRMTINGMKPMKRERERREKKNKNKPLSFDEERKTK